MKAIILKEFGSVDNLIIQDINTPIIKENEVLVKVKTISISPVDAMTRQGSAQSNNFINLDPIILGWGISGEIIEVGNAVLNFKKGDAAFSIVNFPGHGDAYAEYVAVPELQLALKPHNISHREAVSASMSGLTAWQAFTEYGELKAGDKVLVHAAAGGVGHYAVQIAKELGAYVIATDTASNREFVVGLGADEYIDYQTQRFDELIKDIDFVLEAIGGESFARSLSVVKPKGTIVSLVNNVNESSRQLAKEKGIKGSFHMSVKSSGKDLKEIARLLEKGIIKSHISKTFSFEQMAEAHLHIESGRTVGKIVVTL